jgi:hypothetical protein
MRTIVVILLSLLAGSPAWADAEADARWLSLKAAVLFSQAREAEDPNRQIELLEGY